MSDSNQKLQRLLAQQRALAAQIKSLEDREREREEKAIALIIRRHKLNKFDAAKLDQVLARAMAELEGVTQQPQAPESTHAE